MIRNQDGERRVKIVKGGCNEKVRQWTGKNVESGKGRKEWEGWEKDVKRERERNAKEMDWSWIAFILIITLLSSTGNSPKLSFLLTTIDFTSGGGGIREKAENGQGGEMQTRGMWRRVLMRKWQPVDGTLLALLLLGSDGRRRAEAAPDSWNMTDHVCEYT